MLKVAVFSPDPIVRFGVSAFLEKNIENVLVNQFGNIGHYRTEDRDGRYDLVFADLGIYADKVGCLTDLRASFNASSLVVYDLGATFEEGINYIKLGAKGCLPRIIDLEILLSCIETVLTGKFYLEDVSVDILLELVFRQESLFKTKRYLPKLTPRQNEIALLLANGATTTAISQKLGLHMSTVSTFKSIIYRKLNVQNVVQLGSLLA